MGSFEFVPVISTEITNTIALNETIVIINPLFKKSYDIKLHKLKKQV